MSLIGPGGPPSFDFRLSLPRLAGEPVHQPHCPRRGGPASTFGVSALRVRVRRPASGRHPACPECFPRREESPTRDLLVEFFSSRSAPFAPRRPLSGPALVANPLLSRAGEMYDARDRGPNRKSRMKTDSSPALALGTPDRNET